MIILDLVQGTDEWHEARWIRRTASEAAAMIGDSPKMKRNDLLKLKKTGTAKEVSDWVQKNLFDKGHAVEAKARELLEDDIGELLYPVTGTCDDDYLLASMDGLSIDGAVIFEHKMWNEELAVCVRNEDLPMEYVWQLEQQLLVSGAEYAIFVVSDGTRERREFMKYFPVEGRAAQLMAGWAQFDKDLENYVVTEAAPVLTAKKLDQLPQLVIKLKGEVSSSNMAAYRDTAMNFVASINTDLQTDQDFVDAKAAVKFCENAEKELADAKVRALSETSSIKDLLDLFDEVSEGLRKKRLVIDKLVKTREAAIKGEILNAGVAAFNDHIKAINAEIGPRIVMPEVPIDIAGAMKNKRTLDSLRNAVDTELARAKIVANEVADKIRANLKTLRELPIEHQKLLMHDANETVQKEQDDFQNLVGLRIGEWEQKEELRIAEEEKRIKEAAEALAAENKRKEDAEKERKRLEDERLENERKRLDEERIENERIEAERKAQVVEPVAAEEPKAVAEPARHVVAEPDAVAEPARHVEPEPAGTADVVTRPDTSRMTGQSSGLGQVVYPSKVTTTIKPGTRRMVATLVNMDALLQAIVNGQVDMDLIQIAPQAVQDYVDDFGIAPPGFTLASE